MNMERIHDVMIKAIYSAPTAKASIDIACYDLAGKTLGVPVYTLLGGRYHTEFPITHVLSIGKPEDMAAEAMDRVNQGYRSFKMKVGTRVLDDVKRIQAVHAKVDEDIAIRVDVNQGRDSISLTSPDINQMNDVCLVCP